MAARAKRVVLDESWREKIQTSMLINRLTENANGNLPAELTAGQIKSIEILLRKSAPDLQAVTISGDPDNPLLAVVASAGASLGNKLARIVAARDSDPSKPTD